MLVSMCVCLCASVRHTSADLLMHVVFIVKQVKAVENQFVYGWAIVL